MEISYSRFQRVLELPGLSDAAGIVTSYIDGMLLVRIKMGGRS
jgi:HSP20 family molecular chaperone IbpA